MNNIRQNERTQKQNTELKPNQVEINNSLSNRNYHLTDSGHSNKYHHNKNVYLHSNGNFSQNHSDANHSNISHHHNNSQYLHSNGNYNQNRIKFYNSIITWINIITFNFNFIISMTMTFTHMSNFLIIT